MVTVDDVTWVCRRVEDYRPPSWPSADVPMQLHFEFSVDDLARAEAMLVGLGATKPELQPPVPPGANPLTVMRDPAGHLFCIFAR